MKNRIVRFITMFSCFTLCALAPIMNGCDGCRGNEKALEAQKRVQEGLAMEREGHFSDAATAYRIAIATDPTCREAYFQLGTLYERLGAFPQAEASYRKAISLKADAAAYNNLGNVLGSQGKLANAVEAYRAALRHDSSLPSAHFNLGNSLMLAHQFEEAESELVIAVDLKPDELRYNEALGSFYKNNGNPGKALPYLERCAAKDSSRAELMLTLSEVYESLQMFEKAIKALERHLRTLIDHEARGILKTRIRELRMRQTDSKKRALRS